MPCDPKKLRELEEKASVALFDLHKYMEDNGDNFAGHVYSERVSVGMLISARIKYWEMRKDMDA